MSKVREKLIITRLAEATKRLPQGRIMSAIASSSSEQKDRLMRGIRADDPDMVGEAILEMVQATLAIEITTAVDAAIAADAIPVADVEKLVR